MARPRKHRRHEDHPTPYLYPKHFKQLGKMEAVGRIGSISLEANQFAAEFLMPEDEIRKEFKGDVTVALLGELKRKWKVSMISLLYRADDLGFVTPNQKRYILQQFNQLQIRRREPVELDVPVEKPHLLRRWVAQLKEKNKLNAAQTAGLLHLNMDDFIELYS